ncbi:fasciclin domain-containing protein [Algibacter amylolyticus]|uniref:Fasciclin domain-containing protein n=1 Tax=Algibacter amylolyticus TaxID=1608400 RepID=A0A5M7BLC1_9FLAO|nr:fasciclin domain-containing protein [Algibacter amylolyticus]KAA5827705.1 fasciclin domain-containing protein [Algibacter amylolyticus]MBB5266923.1 putative surface protein with fasciclin (FAS1) repeats [Algibacter amylolyticus]TSJ81950.1 fasciclin domain-containing protein [Algibacter amylolyticus]
MKLTKYLFLVFAVAVLFCSCKEANKEVSTTASEAQLETQSTERTGQAFIEGDLGTTVLSIAMGSKDHTTLVAAVQAAQLENALVNAGPLMVFAPTNKAFSALPEGTVENLLKPENKDALANILKYHVTPGNYSKDFLKKFKKLGQANNGYVKVEVVDGEPIIGGARILASIKAGNGIVHVIDKVLLPPTE